VERYWQGKTRRTRREARIHRHARHIFFFLYHSSRFVSFIAFLSIYILFPTQNCHELLAQLLYNETLANNETKLLFQVISKSCFGFRCCVNSFFFNAFSSLSHTALFVFVIIPELIKFPIKLSSVGTYLVQS
jgi:hypothetical protein